MSNLTQFFGGGGGEGVGLGAYTTFPMFNAIAAAGSTPTLPPTTNIGDQIYLISGANTLAANADSAVLQMPHLCLRDQTTAATSVRAYNIASNADGSVLIAAGQTPTTQIFRSTNGGVTWSPITFNAQNSGGTFTLNVVWTGSRFLIVGNLNSNTSVDYSTSTDGVTWSSQTLMFWNSGSNVFVNGLSTDGNGNVLAVSNAANVYRLSTDGAASFSAGTAPNSNNRQAAVFNNLFILFGPGTGFSTAPISSPTTWTNRTSSVSFSNTATSIIGGVSSPTRVVVPGYGGGFTSTDGINWEYRLSPFRSSSADNGLIQFDGSYFYYGSGTVSTSVSPGAIVRTQDFLTFETLNLTQQTYTAAGAHYRFVGATAGKVFIGSGGGGDLTYINPSATPERVGTRTAQTVDSFNMYWRIK